MFSNMRTLLKLTTVVALAANACAANGVRPVESAAATLSCAGGSIQSAADAALYGACGSVNGDLRISAADLTDLSTLSQLRSISGKLDIAGNPQLDDLSGLERLEHVGSLAIRDNADLDDVSALGGLKSASSVVISGNGELGSLAGLEGLTRLSALVIEHNGLYQTAGLSNLTEVGTLVIEDNAKLNSLQGLRSLAHAGSVEITGNPLLCALGMLPALKHVDHEVVVNHNRGLSSPDVQQLLGRVERGLVPSTNTVARLDASLR